MVNDLELAAQQAKQQHALIIHGVGVNLRSARWKVERR